MRKHNLFWGLLLIIVGTLFTVQNLGILRINLWGMLWPGFLITLGVWTIWATRPGQLTGNIEQAAIRLEAANQARVKIGYGGGRIHLRGAAPPGDLVSGDFGGGLSYKTQSEGNLAILQMKPAATKSPVIFIPWLWGPRDWIFDMTGEVPLALDIESGGADIRLNLTDLLVRELKLSTGASAADIYLPAKAGTTKVKVSGGATTTNLRVPAGAAARIKVGGALTSTTIDRERFPKKNEFFESLNYEVAENKIDIDIEIGLGTLDIR